MQQSAVHYLKKGKEKTAKRRWLKANEREENGIVAATKENFSKIISVAQVECRRVEVKREAKTGTRNRSSQIAKGQKVLNTLSIIN